MTWFYRAALDSDPDFTIDAESGRRRGKTLERFVGRLVLEQTEAFTLSGWKQPRGAQIWGVEVLEDGRSDPEPDVVIRIHRDD